MVSDKSNNKQDNPLAGLRAIDGILEKTIPSTLAGKQLFKKYRCDIMCKFFNENNNNTLMPH